MKLRFIFLLFVISSFHTSRVFSYSFLINQNNATPKSLTPIFQQFSDQAWLGLDFVGADFHAFTAAQGEELGKVLMANQPDYFTLQFYKAGSGTKEGLWALLEQMKLSQTYYLIKSRFDGEQGKILGQIIPPVPLFSFVDFDDPASFARSANKNIFGGFSGMNDGAAQVMINNTSADQYSSMHGLMWSNNGKNLTSAPVIEVLQNAIKNPPNQLSGFDFSNSVGISTNIAPFIGSLIDACPLPSRFSFNFSGILHPNSNDVMAAVINNFKEGDLRDMENTFFYNHGNLTSFSKEWWTFLLQKANTLFFAHNNLGNSMQTFAQALLERPSSTSLWLDLSSNSIDDDGAIIFFNALGDYLEANHPTEGFYFSFGGNPLGDRGMDALVRFLGRFGQFVDQCPWNQVAFDGSKFSEQNWIKLFEALKSMDLSSISLKRSNLQSPAAMQKLGELIRVSPKIWFVYLDQSSITDDGMITFSDAISKITHLPSYLELSGNKIGTTGSLALATSLKTVIAATNINLYLNNNIIGTEGAKALIKVNDERAIASVDLAKNPSINVDILLPLYATQKAGSINLSSMGLTDSHALTLASIIELNPVFENLIVSDNQIGDEGMLALGRAFINSLKNLAKPEEAPSSRLDLTRDAYFKYRPQAYEIKARIKGRLPYTEPSKKEKEGLCSMQ